MNKRDLLSDGIILNGTPDNALGVVDMVLDKAIFRKEKYKRMVEMAPLVKCFIIRSIGTQTPWRIGILTFQLLSDGKRTLFRVPRPLPEDEICNDAGAFDSFLNHLFFEYQRLEFIALKEEKPPMGFKLPPRNG